jgi:hypothetical protein
MCRSIKTLRPPYAEQVTDEDIRAAALQYVRKISGFRAPAGHNAEAFGHAVDAVAAATAALLDQLEIRTAQGQAHRATLTALPRTAEATAGKRSTRRPGRAPRR